MLVKMTAGQIRQIKPMRFAFIDGLGSTQTYSNNDYDLLWTDKELQIIFDNGEIHLFNLECFDDCYSNLVKGMDNDQEVFVEKNIWEAWKEQQQKPL